MFRTGDIGNALSNLKSALRKVKYDGGLDEQRARDGSPEFFLPLVHFAVLGYSRPLARHLGRRGHDLYGKSDLKFIEGVYRVLRDEFKYSPKLNKAQFFSTSFAEQKVLLTTDIVRLCHTKHKELAKLQRNKSPSRPRPTEPGKILLPPELGPSYADFGPVPTDTSWHGTPDRPGNKPSPFHSSASPRSVATQGVALHGPADTHRFASFSLPNSSHDAVPAVNELPAHNASLDVTDDFAPATSAQSHYPGDQVRTLPTHEPEPPAEAHSLSDQVQIETFYAPDSDMGEAICGGAVKSEGGWATHSLSAYSDAVLPHQIIRSSIKQTGRGSGRDGHATANMHTGKAPAAGTGPDEDAFANPVTSAGREVDGTMAAAFQSMERLASCVETLTSRLDRIEHTAFGGHGGAVTNHGGHGYPLDDRTYLYGHTVAEEMRESVRSMEARLVTIQDAFQDTVQSMSARMMLMQQRLVALETAQSMNRLLAEAPLETNQSQTGATATVEEPPYVADGGNEQIRAVYASLARLETSLGHETLDASIRTPPRAGVQSFRPPSTSSPRRPQARLRPQ